MRAVKASSVAMRSIAEAATSAVDAGAAVPTNVGYCIRGCRRFVIVLRGLGPDSLSVTLLDGERFLYGRSREHPVVMRLECWIGA